MITKVDNEVRKVVSRPKTVFKIVKGFLQPLLILFAGFCAFLSLMTPVEGSRSRTVAVILLLLSVAAIATLKFVEYLLCKNDFVYRTFVPRCLREAQPSKMLPLILTSIVVILPLYIMLINSIKTPAEANYIIFTWFPTKGVTTLAYEELFSYGELVGISIWRALWNSFIYAVPPCTVGLFMSAASAFMFSKFEFKGKKAMWSVLIVTTLMPSCVTLATSYLMFDLMGWTNTPLPLIVPGMLGGVGLVMYLRGYFSAISNSILEAAEIDGAGKIRQFFSIMLPLAKPALIAQFILTFIGKFNDYMGPLLYLQDPAKYTIQIALTFFNSSPVGASVVAASCVCALVPMLILYILAQKQILSNVAMSAGVKA